MLAAYEAQYHIPYVGVRLCHTFGPGISLEDGRAFSEFIRNVIKKRGYSSSDRWKCRKKNIYLRRRCDWSIVISSYKRQLSLL